MIPAPVLEKYDQPPPVFSDYFLRSVDWQMVRRSIADFPCQFYWNTLVANAPGFHTLIVLQNKEQRCFKGLLHGHCGPQGHAYGHWLLSRICWVWYEGALREPSVPWKTTVGVANEHLIEYSGLLDTLESVRHYLVDCIAITKPQRALHSSFNQLGSSLERTKSLQFFFHIY